MEQLRTLTPDEIYLADVIYPQIKKFDFDKNHHGVILEWREGTSREIKEDVISTLNNSKYVLVELPFHNPILNLDDIIYELKYNNLIPIIAHPERYTYFQKNYKEVDKLREEGVLFQGNYLSIIGGYGSLSKKLFKYMLKNKYIDFLGTDIHSLNNLSVIDNYDKIIKKIKKVCGEEYYQVIINNCNNVLKNI